MQELNCINFVPISPLDTIQIEKEELKKSLVILKSHSFKYYTNQDQLERKHKRL